MKKIVPYMVAVIVTVMMVLVLFQQKKMGPAMEVEKQKEYVNSLLNKGLYRKAAGVYEKIIDSPGISKKQRSNLAYLTGNIYLENLRDYENALAAYLKVKILTPKSGIMDEVNQKSVECLERLGRSLDARMEMEKHTSPDKNKGKAPKGALVVAKIGEREITMDQLRRKINDLPPYYQEMFKSSEKQLEFLQQFIATELFYEKAKRKGYDKDKDIIAQAFEAKKAAMMQKLIKEEIQDKIKITDKEIELYYESHREDYIEKKDGKERQETLTEAKSSIRAALGKEKEEKLMKDFMVESFISSDVKIYDDLFGISKGKKTDNAGK